MLNFGGAVVPGDNSEFRVHSGDGDEIFPLWYVDRLQVGSWRESDISSGFVFEWYAVDCILQIPEVAGSILRHLDYFRHYQSPTDPSGELCRRYKVVEGVLE